MFPIRLYLYFATLLTAVLLTLNAQADHNSGLHIAYTCVGGNDYEITVYRFRECADPEPASPLLDVYIYSDCAVLGFLDFPLQATQEVSQLCPAALPNSNCAGGTEPGVELNTYSMMVTLDPCINWRIVVAEQNRSGVTNLVDPEQNRIHVEAFLNNASGECNSSPQLGVFNLPFVCAGSPLFYNLGFSESDGDSLVYSLSPALTSLIAIAPFEMQYLPSYSGAAPIAGISINPSNGQINVTPGLIGKFNAVVQVQEYRNGELIGTVSHDFIFSINACPVPSPAPVAGSLNHVSGGGYPVGDQSIGICQGDDFCFEIAFSSADPGFNISITSTIEALLPGATLSVSGSNPATALFCGSIPVNFTGGSFLTIASDDACPVMGQSFYAIDLVLRSPLVAGTDSVICSGNPLTLFASNGGIHTWSTLSGNDIAAGPSFTCNPCDQPTASPDTSTTYVVTGLYPNSTCANSAEVQITVPLSWSLTSGNESCDGNDGSITIDIADGSGNYEVIWDDLDPSGLSRTGLQAGAYGFTVTDVLYGCTRSASIDVAADSYPDANAGVDSVHCGLTYQLQAQPSFGTGQWTIPTGLSLSDPFAPNAELSASAEGNYTLLWIENAGGGCSDTSTVQLGLFLPPQISNAAWTCTGTDATYQLSFSAIQGNSSAYMVAGVPGSFSGNVFTSAPQPSDSPLEVVLSDGGICGSDTLMGSQTCPVLTYAGTMATDTLRICGDTAAEVEPTMAAVLDGNDTLLYALHDEAGALLVNVLSWSSSPGFAFQDAMSYESVYYISAVVGNASANGVDLSDPFLSVAAGTPIIFYATPSALMQGDAMACPYDTTVIEVQLSGTLPQALVYSINGAEDTVWVDEPLHYLAATEAGIYQLLSTSSAWCVGQASGTAVLGHYDLPQVSYTLPEFICAGDTAELLLSFSGEAPFSFQWNHEGDVEQVYSNDNQLSMALYEGGNYLLSQLSDLRCIADSTLGIFLDVRPLPQSAMDEVGPACSGDTLYLGSAPVADHLYQWDPHPGLLSLESATAGFSLANNGPEAVDVWLNRAATLNGCHGHDSLLLQLYPYPQAGMAGVAPFCAGDSIFLAGFGAPQLQWQPEAFFAQPNAPATWFKASTGTDISLEASNEGGCTTQVSAWAEVWPKPVPVLVADVLEGCIPLEANIEVLNHVEGHTYLWHLGGKDNPGGASYSALIDKAGSWAIAVQATSAEGCVGRDTLPYTIETFDTMADFTYEPANPSISAPQVYFYNTSPQGVESNWTFGDFGNSSARHAGFAFPEVLGGDYEVCLEVRSPEGCKDRMCKILRIADDFFLYIPNAFSPNGDGINDRFGPVLSRLDPVTYRFSISNRRGQVIWATDNPTDMWDGSGSTGEHYEQNTVYIWQIEARPDFDVATRSYAGSVFLLR